MKLRLIMAVLMLPIGLAGNAFAFQGENIAFERLDGDALVAGRVSADAEDAAGQGPGQEDFESLNDCDVGVDLAQIAIGPATAQDPINGVARGSASMDALAKIIAPVGASVFVPNHCISMSENGMGTPPDGDTRVLAGANAFAYGELDAGYATSPGLANPPNAANMYATMDVFLYFLGTGLGCSNLRVNPGVPDFNKFNTDDCGEFTVSGGGFSQRIKVGDTDITVTHLGNGVFATNGVLSASTEKSPQNFTVPFMDTSLGCGVNHLWTARQRVPIDSMGANVVDVEMRSTLATTWARFTNGSGTSTSIGENVWNWVSVSSVFFFARDYITDDSCPCNPTKVLVEGDKGGLGHATIDGQTLAAYHDLSTVTVVIAAGEVFECDLDIFDQDTGQLVAHFDADQAAYDAATGMAVFDLSSAGPFAPGIYDIEVGALYQTEVYVAIPGDVNLDGVVDCDDLEIVEDNLNNPGVWTTGDVTCDGVVDDDDLAVVEDQLPLLGDVNLDGVVNFLDISAFIDVLVSGGYQAEADINKDGAVNFLDIAPFIDVLTSG